MRYTLSNQAMRNVYKELGDAEIRELGERRKGCFKGQVIDTAKWYLSHVTMLIGYDAVVSLNEHWEKDWEIEITIDEMQHRKVDCFAE